MLTKKVKNRLLFITSVIILSGFVILFIIKTLNKNLLYFRTPTEINQNNNIKVKKSFRVGGMVKLGSISISDKEIKFIISDCKNEIIVSYQGPVPNLFSEGKGVIAEGKLNDKKYFIAHRILAKHDENYMPPELEKIMKKNVK